MSKLSKQEEKELVSFLKDWLKSLGFNQKDLANELNIKSSRTSEIILKINLNNNFLEPTEKLIMT